METAVKKTTVTETGITTKWAFDTTHTEIGFKVRHLMVTNVRGLFRDVDVQVLTNGTDFSGAQINFSMKAASVETGEANRDAHLRSADFFDAGNFPLITFGSTSFKSVADGEYELVGDLTIRGVTKQVKLDVEFGGTVVDPWGNIKAGFTLTGKLLRKDFGLVWNAALESGGVLVGEEVKIFCDVELAKLS